MNFNIFNTLILVGIIQGFIFGVAVLLLPKYRNRSNYFLVALIISVTLNNLQYYLKDISVLDYRQLMSVYYIPFATLNCTILYLYVKSLLFPEDRMSRSDRLLFVPFLFFVLVTSVFKVLLFINPAAIAIEKSYSDFANIHELFAVFYSLLLVVFAFKLVIRYVKNRKVFNVSIVHQQLIWLKITLSLLFVVIFIYAYLMVKVILFPTVPVNFHALWISNSFMIYWLGHIGIYKYGIQKERQNIRKYLLAKGPDMVVAKKQNTTINSFEKLMVEDKRFLDSSVSLEIISAELEVSKGHLSRLIKSELNTNFTDYINLLRIEEAKNYLINPDFSNYTLAAIGLEAGFNSKSTFYSTFKKCTGLTPLQFKNSNTI